ncbi:MAG: dipeptidase [Planctomycetota bacterium]|jgi:acetylornithine deacetylase/succinyl-diaminopimelate desuccinylase-like protein
MSSDLLAPVLRHIDETLDQSVQRTFELLRIPSISTDPAHAADTRRAADWLAEHLSEMGFDASVRTTSGHPMVVAHDGPRGPGTPRVLYYGHYDVQPPDPLDLWETPPFEPTVVEAEHGPRIVARGAVDDKGQLMTFVEAFRAWKAVHGDLPVGVTVMLEGEEESGSPSLDPFLRGHREELAADVCVVCDTGMWNIDTPAITYMLRGMLYVEVTLHGPSHDLHSGMYGGAVVNPINALCRVIADLHDEDGRVRIPGFYDEVRAVADDELAQWNALDFDESGFLGGAGLTRSTGEAGHSTLERLWSRPTCDCNGIIGGYTGAGAKTVIGASATCKLSCRLVADQDPIRILEGLQAFLEARTPPDCRWEIATHGANPAIRVPTESPWLEAAAAGLEDVYGRRPVLMGCGGSIPVVGSIQQILGFDSLLVGFALDDDRIHSPNEKFEMRCFEHGVKSHAAILARFAEVAARATGAQASPSAAPGA